jgi:hypothetical protein
MTVSKAYLAAFAFVVSGSCFAQANVGDVMKLSAVKMSKEELQQLHSGGVTMKGTLGNGSPYSQQNKADGTIAGTAGNNGQFTLTGTWKIDDSGKYCHDVAASGGLKFNNCSVIWKAGDRYFASADDAPASPVRERQFVK